MPHRILCWRTFEFETFFTVLDTALTDCVFCNKDYASTKYTCMFNSKPLSCWKVLHIKMSYINIGRIYLKNDTHSTKSFAVNVYEGDFYYFKFLICINCYSVFYKSFLIYRPRISSHFFLHWLTSKRQTWSF